MSFQLKAHISKFRWNKSQSVLVLNYSVMASSKSYLGLVSVYLVCSSWLHSFMSVSVSFGLFAACFSLVSVSSYLISQLKVRISLQQSVSASFSQYVPHICPFLPYIKQFRTIGDWNCPIFTFSPITLTYGQYSVRQLKIWYRMACNVSILADI